MSLERTLQGEHAYECFEVYPKTARSTLLGYVRGLCEAQEGQETYAEKRAEEISVSESDAHLTMEAGNPVEYLPVISEDEEKTLLGLVTTRDLAECGM